MRTTTTCRMTLGANPTPEGTQFCVWAPESADVTVVLSTDEEYPLEPEPDGYHSGFLSGIKPGATYRYRLDDAGPFPDPASRFQPDGVHGVSQVIDSNSFPWTDELWRGVEIKGLILYEMHIGTFTQEGTWASAMAELPRLAELGITCLEIMPVNEFAGRFGWGYDGTFWFAPTHLYGTPDDFRAFVDQAHALSLGVILDVVYNHLGPDGNYLPRFSPYYFSDQATEWGDAINFDGKRSQAVREFVISNTRYWIEEFHLDGLRIDATHQIFDQSGRHIIADMVSAARSAASPRKIVVIGENEPNDTRLVVPERYGGMGLNALWNDDFHHSAYVALTGRNEAYYSGFQGSPQELISSIKYGCLYQGQHYLWQHRRRGRPGLNLAPFSSVIFLENHDQTANSMYGARLRSLVDPSLYRSLTALFLLAPGTPMLFQGQEYGELNPFCYFADHHEELATLVYEGRLKHLVQFPSIAASDPKDVVPDPRSIETFNQCKLSFAHRDNAIVALHRDLLALRRSDPAFLAQERGGVDGAVLSANAFALRFLTGDKGDRLLLVNLGADLYLPSPAEPLLASPTGNGWELMWTSENPLYGGSGIPEVETNDGWRISARSCTALRVRNDE